MAFGLPPSYNLDLELDDLNGKRFLIHAVERAAALGWRLRYVCADGFVATTDISWGSYGEIISVRIQDHGLSLKSECIKHGIQFFDWGKNKRNIQYLVSYAEELGDNISDGELEEQLIHLQQRFPAKEIAYWVGGSGKKEGLFSFFTIKEGYLITPLLVMVNLLVFVLMALNGVNIINPDLEDLLRWGANFGPLTGNRQLGRLLTACFVHIGVMHLIWNMFALVYVGRFLEPYLGRTVFLAAYLLTGVTASLTSLWWYDYTLSAGASGAILGMYGFFLVLLMTKRLEMSIRKDLWISIGLFIVYNLVNGFLPGRSIDNAAHIGGLLSGIFVGFAFIPSLKKGNLFMVKGMTIVILAVMLLVASGMVYRKLPKNMGHYHEEMKRVVSMESLAMEVYRLPKSTSKEKMLYALEDRGAYYWEESIKIIDDLNTIELPPAIRERNALLRKYCEVRLKSFRLLYKTLDEGTDSYQGQLKKCSLKIQQISKELKKYR